MVLVASLLDLKDWLLFFEVWFKSGDAFEPVVEQFVAGLVQTFAYLVASLFKLDTFLLGFPGCSENQRHFVLVKLQFVVEIIHPHNFVYDIRQITGFVKSFIHLILVEQLRFKFVNVFVHLIQELALVLDDCATNLGSGNHLVEVREDLEHVAGCHRF